jgi:hypothetical protein
MTTTTIPHDLADRLATQLCAMTSALQRGDGLSVANVYADDALLSVTLLPNNQYQTSRI